MRTAIASLKSASPYSQSRFLGEHPKGDKETHRDHEARVWKFRTHADKAGNIYIPPMSFKNCLAEAARYLSVQIPGKGKSTYTKHFEAGVMVMEPLLLPLKRDDVEGEWLHVPSDGRRGSGKRVEKCFPVIHEWAGDVPFVLLDDTITPEVFMYHLQQAGSFIGIGRFRPRNNGFYGRFSVDKITWK